MIYLLNINECKLTYSKEEYDYLVFEYKDHVINTNGDPSQANRLFFFANNVNFLGRDSLHCYKPATADKRELWECHKALNKAFFGQKHYVFREYREAERAMEWLSFSCDCQNEVQFQKSFDIHEYFLIYEDEFKQAAEIAKAYLTWYLAQ